ncbi:unnamed protein product [marine sediment metagenome]|uniref:Uncharacterized protein n=1 Tax=marine sediment metagenome TaxID=412755 RepID=X1GX02_9ZZZZ
MMEEKGIKITIEHDKDGMIFSHREMNLVRLTTGDLAMLFLELERAKLDVLKIQSTIGPLYSVHKKKGR